MSVDIDAIHYRKKPYKKVRRDQSAEKVIKIISEAIKNGDFVDKPKNI